MLFENLQNSKKSIFKKLKINKSYPFDNKFIYVFDNILKEFYQTKA